MTFSHLLIAIAPEQPLGQSFHQALHFANRTASRVTLLTIIKDLAEFKEVALHTSSTLDLLDKATQIYHDVLKDHVHTLRAQYPKIKFQTQIRLGIPAIEIIKAAKETQAQLIIIDSHREQREQACQSGTTTRHLMRKSDVPIWSISHTRPSIRRVVAAVDMDVQDNNGFREKIVALAIDFCAETGAELTLAHAWRLESEGFLRNWSGYSDLEIAIVAKKMRADRHQRLNDLLEPYAASAVKMQVQLLEGDARTILPDYVEQEGIDVVILGSLSRSGVAGFLMGNTAESMLNKLSCSVLTLKPDGFLSPVFIE